MRKVSGNLLEVFKDPVACAESFDVTRVDEQTLTRLASRNDKITQFNRFQRWNIILWNSRHEIRFQRVHRVVDAGVEVWIRFMTHVKEIGCKSFGD